MNKENTLFDLPQSVVSEKIEKTSYGKPRLKSPIRNQMEIISKSLDDFLPDDHKARIVWSFVDKLDLSILLGKIKSVESGPGAPAIDPKILMALWLYAFVEGIISAKIINRYCTEHIGFKWICGGVSVNEHTISDFRTDHGDAFDDLLTQSIAILLQQDMITISSYAQDGMKVEANAGKSSFRREKTLKETLKSAKEHIEALKEELQQNPGAMSKRQAAAKKRAADEQALRTQNAISELKKLRAEKELAAKKKGNSFTEKDKQEVRSSTTDPEARVMKMSNSGFAPAYNVQLASDIDSKAILGVYVTQAGHDYGQLEGMKKQVEQRLGTQISNILCDQGFLQHDDVNNVSKSSKVYIPSELIKHSHKYESINEIKERMQTEEAKEMYKKRPSTAEFSNARLRNRGLTQVLVSGLPKVQVVATLFAIGHNMLLWMSGCL